MEGYVYVDMRWEIIKDEFRKIVLAYSWEKLVVEIIIDVMTLKYKILQKIIQRRSYYLLMLYKEKRWKGRISDLC
jgi:hypothetical protein